VTCYAHTTVFGDVSFSVAGPLVWNVLPSYQRQDINYRYFKQSLKRHILAIVDDSVL